MINNTPQEAKKILHNLESKNQNYWIQIQQQNSLRLFYEMSKKIPAYKKFLKSNKINPAKIKTYQDLQSVPFTSKQNYFQKNSLTDTTWPNYLQKNLAPFCATSGSTGLPTFFPRTDEIGMRFSFWSQYFENLDKGPTLVINAFGLGLWMAGMLTYEAYYFLGQRGYPIGIANTGINKIEIFKTLRNVAGFYKNVLLIGYPPFIKDVIEEAKVEKIDFSKFNFRIILSGETFTETFRDSLINACSIKNIYTGTGSIYGCSEGGAVGWETPTCILIKRLALKYSEIYNKLFAQQKNIPTFAQYNPMYYTFESQGQELLMTTNSATPIIRYKMGDNGGILFLKEIKEVFSNFGINLEQEAKKAKIKLLDLPFISVYQRTDFSISFYGLQIYPETIKRAVEISALQKFLTGKFTMLTSYDEKNNQYVEINLELKPGTQTNKKFQKISVELITATLLKESSEYREVYRMLGAQRTKPKLVFWSYNHEKFFRSGTKQKWIQKLPNQSPIKIKKTK